MGSVKSRGSAEPDSGPRKWKRRDLLKLPIPMCALAALAGSPTPAGAASTQDKKAKGEKRLCTYCGFYCGMCDVYQGIVSDHAEQLQRLMKFYGLKAETFEVDADSYSDFETVLSSVVEKLDDIPPCSEGCSLYAGCEIRPCARERGVETCAFCDDFPCAKVKAFDEKFKNLVVLRRQKEIGLQAWADEQAALVAAGKTFSS